MSARNREGRVVYPEHLTVLAGKVEVESGSAHVRAVLGEGQTARYRADQPHAIRNPFDAPAVVIVVVTSAMHASSPRGAEPVRVRRPSKRPPRSDPS